MKLFIVIDEESSPKDAIYSIHTTMDAAKKSDKELQAMAVGGRVTTIIEEQINGNDTVLLPKNLTAENGAKGLLIGDFYEYVEVAADEDYREESGEETVRVQVPVSWSNIKLIYDKVVSHFA